MRVMQVAPTQDWACHALTCLPACHHPSASQPASQCCRLCLFGYARRMPPLRQVRALHALVHTCPCHCLHEPRSGIVTHRLSAQADFELANADAAHSFLWHDSRAACDGCLQHARHPSQKGNRPFWPFLVCALCKRAYLCARMQAHVSLCSWSLCSFWS